MMLPYRRGARGLRGRWDSFTRVRGGLIREVVCCSFEVGNGWVRRCTVKYGRVLSSKCGLLRWFTCLGVLQG